MANLSSIVTPTNVLTANNTQTVTNKTIDGASNTLTNIAAVTAVTATTATVANTVAVTGTVTAGQYLNVPFINNTIDGNYQLEVSDDIRVYPSLNIIYLDGNTSITGVLNPNVIDFTDGTGTSEHLRFGSSDDVKMFYNGVNNTMELELETGADSFIITDNGTTRFTFEKATGDLAATTFTGNLVGNADTVTNGLYTTSTIDGGTF